ncbi:Acetyl esterase/lipase [Desulfatibacillum alkenivorans DSM 16219]|uniref:Acetyl esterase/lipase n=2 Tax=Desulfatibacillum alkenivorans TaxID=259354 RepID=A0A1M6I819_9BACT|nr:Acetyl esterase/lipase [Desulfatibacillum alkenivorans DSM 16219]
MQSLRSRAIIFLMKHRHWFSLKLKAEVIDFNSPVAEMRAKVEKSAARMAKMPEGMEAVPADMQNPTGEIIRYKDSQDDRMILYFHGGGYVMGSVKSHRGIVAKFVKGTGINALCFEYRLAPEHPFPAALNDAVAAYQWLLDQGTKPGCIVFMGDSAGAGLALAALLALKEKSLPQPAAAAVMSPWADVACTGESYKKTDPVAPKGSFSVYGTYYAGDNDKTNPLVSPVYGNPEGLPPLFLSVGEDERILDDSVRFAEKAEKAGVDATLKVGEGMVHCYPVLSPMFPEAKEAMDEICAFVKTRLGGYA